MGQYRTYSFFVFLGVNMLNVIKKAGLSLAAAGTVALFAFSASAAPVIYNDSIADGTAAFDNAVTGVGGVVQTDTLSNLSNGNTWNRGDYTISSTNGTNRPIDNNYNGNLTGNSIGINPTNNAAGSGLTFTFNTAINAFGLEVGDWATCCFPSALYIAFDGGATRQVAVANNANDNPGFAKDGVFTNFVAGIDTSATFTTVTFYGDGVGEYLVAGSVIRYATLDIGSIPDVPEPFAAGLVLFGLAGMGLYRRRRQAA